MSIIFNSEKQIFLLNTPSSTYVIKIHSGKYLLHGGWFKRISHWTDNCSLPLVDYVMSPVPADLHDIEDFSLDSQQQEFPVSGRGDFRTGAIEIQTADGTCTLDLRYDSHKIFKGKPNIEGLPSTYVENDEQADTLEINLYDELCGILVTLSYTVWNSYDAICRHVIVKNTGSGKGKYEGKKIIIKKVMSCSMDFSTSRYKMMTLMGAATRERHPVIRDVVQGIQSVESRRTMSSHQQNPFMALLSYDSTETTGEVFGFSLVYSGNFTALAEADQFHITRAQIGINPYNFSWTLEKGEKFFSPEVVMVYSSNGLNAMSQTYHAIYNNNLVRGTWKNKERPILINNWEATYFNFTPQKIFEIADVAKKVGVEMFVLDDGWFGNRNDDRSSLGDWYVNKTKLPEGLLAISEGIKKRGMKFGLWVEPEMISPDSDLYRAHPDWCLHIDGRDKTLGRHQLVLDLSRDDVVDYLTETLSNVFSSADISYVKWDFNRSPTEVGSATLSPERQMETSHRYVLGLYKLLENLVTRFPQILFESCSSGGGRFDPAMFYYMPQCWTSDNTDALSRLFIQDGTSVVYPPSFMTAHVSAVPNHQVGRITSLSMRGHVAMRGILGYELDLTKMTEEEIAEIAEQVSFYKKIRRTMQFGKTYRLESTWSKTSSAEYTKFCAWQSVSEDEKQIVLTVAWLYPESNVPPEIIRLQSLDENAFYQAAYSTGESKKFSGAELMYAGIPIKFLASYGGSVLVEFQKIN